MFMATMDIIKYWVLYGFAFLEEIQCSSLDFFKDGGRGEDGRKYNFLETKEKRGDL